VVSGVQSLDGSQQTLNAEEARRNDPVAVAQREESRTKFENLDTEQAAKLASEAFPVVVDEQAGGLPRLPAGESVTGYPTDHAARVDLPGGGRGVVESLEPIAVETSPGQRAPVDLGLGDVGGAFEPRTPVVGVRLPKRLGEGVLVSGVGVSLTPVDGQGAVLGGSEGGVDGSVVLYANTQTDTDTVAKPTTLGFEVLSFLRSVESPQQLSFRVGLPQGASLVPVSDGSGAVRVVDEGTVLGTVLAPSARDAAGMLVPVSMTVAGNTLTVMVDHRLGQYQYPIVVDPSFNTKKDEHLTGYGSPTNWLFCTSHSAKCEHEEGQFRSTGWGENGYLKDEASGSYKSPERAEFIYQTQGESHVQEFTYNTEESNNEGDNLESSVVIENESHVEEGKLLSVSKNASEAGTLVSSIESYHNAAAYVQAASSETAGNHFTDTLKSAVVNIYQPSEVQPKITMDTTDEKLNGGQWINVLYGENKWMGPNNLGAVGFTVEEKGIGIEQILASWSSGTYNYQQNLLEEGKCKGLQCPEKVTTAFTYNSGIKTGHLLPSGRDTVLMAAVGSIRNNTVQEPSINVNVDAEKPFGLALTGLPASGVVDGVQYHLHGEATDGKAPTPSSGIKSLVLALDGYQLPGKAGTCTPGPCSVNGEWAINGEEFGAGKHTLTLQAIDNAGNEERKEYSITVRHAPVLPVGPGSVDPITGALHLSATDVTVGGGAGSLGVSRSYDSRQLTAGEQGPLGPQWSMSISGSQGVEQEPTGSVVLIGADGGRTTFESNGKGGFISPKGDENLVLEAEKEGEKVKAYLLKNPAAGTTVKYTQPTGSRLWVIASSEGVLSKTNGEKETFEWEMLEGVTRPKRAIESPPQSVTCSPPELKNGCRALEFSYATETTATGEASSEWKNYKGRLEKVSFTAYNSATKAMATTVVADYVYDKRGRLRAEWDPRISPALKIVYGYDEENHVVASSAPGQEPWLLRYGTTSLDSSVGRLLSVVRPAAVTATVLKEQREQPTPVNTAVPTLSSTTPKVGVPISVSANGTWSNGPLAYSYQWEDCNSSGKECVLIPGAVNQGYYPTKNDEGHTLVGQVSAVNATGSALAFSAATSTVASGTPTNTLPEPPALGTNAVTTIDYNVPISGSGAPHEMTKAELEKWGQSDDPTEATAIFPADEPMGWPAKDYQRASITYYDEAGHAVNHASPSGAISTSEYNETNEVIRSLSANNRAAALKETKSKEAAELLDTKSKYNGETKEEKEAEEKEGAVEAGTRLLEARGPQHTVKLANGSEVKARNHVKYYYDEGAPQGERYDLVTMTTDGAEYEGKEADVRTTTTSYSGQQNLGWRLRKPTSVITDHNNGLQNTFKFQLGSGKQGSGNGEFKEPLGVAVGTNGDVWVADTFNHRVQEFNAAGEYLMQFGKAGKENGQFSAIEGIAVAPNGTIYVADTGNNRVEEFNEKGEYIAQFGNTGEGELRYPVGVAVAPSGNVYVVNRGIGEEHRARVDEFTEKGEYIRKFGEETGTNTCEGGALKRPRGIAVASNGNVDVANTGSNCIEQFSETGSVLGSFGKEGSGEGQFKEPGALAFAPSGSIYVADTGNSRIEEFTKPGTYLGQFGSEGSGTSQFNRPYGVAVAPGGGMYIADTENNRVQRWEGSPAGLNLIHTTIYDPYTGKAIETRTPAAGPSEESSTYTFKFAFGSKGSGNGQLNEPHGIAVAPNGTTYVADTANNRVQGFNATGEYLTQFGQKGSGNGQFSKPEGIAIAANGNIYVADTGNNRVQEFNEKGEYITQFGRTGEGELNAPAGITISASGNIYVLNRQSSKRVSEFTEKGEYIRKFGEENGSNTCEFGLLKEPRGITVASNSVVDVASTGSDCIGKYAETGGHGGFFGSEGSGNGQFNKPGAIAAGTNKTLYVADTGNNRVQEFSNPGIYLGQFGSKGTGVGQFEGPSGIAVASNGGVWKGQIYVVDTGNNRIEAWMPPKVSTSAHVSQTIYYSAQANNTYPSCGSHPEWAELPCQSQPAAQPGTSNLPELPVVTNTYNMWDEPETVTEKFGSTTTRTKKMTYDEAGRLRTNEETSTTGTSLPKVTDEYSSETGALEKQSTTTGSETKTITRTINTLGQLVEYTDADGNATKYVYSGPANDSQVEEVNYGGKKGSQMYSYDPTTKTLTKLLDLGPEGGAGAGTFTASYDLEYKMTSETYPNGMTTKYTRNPVGEDTEITYEKTTHCTEKCTWFSETTMPSIHGEVLARTSTLAKEEYTYDNAARLTQVQETPAGKGCKTRIYAYDEDSNRTSLTTREPGAEGKCATTGGTAENHTYDEADRLIDTNVSYETFGNQTKIPATDAEGHEITATFYVDNQTHTQTQNGETLTYNTDPEGRNREIESTGTTNSKTINHYPGPGEAISWASEGAEKWTRNVPGIDGTLSATQHNSETAVLQLHDLQGNIIATAALSETETKLLTTYNSTEYGVPTNGTPPKYSWLGAVGLTTELPSGATASRGASYVPQLGKPLQTQPVVPPGAPTMMYIAPYVSTLTPGMYEAASAYAAGALGREATRQREAKEQWEREHPATPPGAIPMPGEGGAEGGLCEGAKALWCDEYGVNTGQLPEGTDPYICCGVYVAFFIGKIQIHFNQHDSELLAVGAFATFETYVLTKMPEPFKKWVAGILASLAFGTVQYIQKHNCIGVTFNLFSAVIPYPAATPEWYRSKHECG
jgi:sugar lactone lactonase YvrE